MDRRVSKKVRGMPLPRQRSVVTGPGHSFERYGFADIAAFGELRVAVDERCIQDIADAQAERLLDTDFLAGDVGVALILRLREASEAYAELIDVQMRHYA